MKLELEVSGGFTGKAGMQVLRLDTEHIAPELRAKLHQSLEDLPDTVWGHSYMSPSPQSWDFNHKLTVIEDGKEKSVQFHLGQGPQELTTIAALMKE